MAREDDNVLEASDNQTGAPVPEPGDEHQDEMAVSSLADPSDLPAPNQTVDNESMQLADPDVRAPLHKHLFFLCRSRIRAWYESVDICSIHPACLSSFKILLLVFDDQSILFIQASQGEDMAIPVSSPAPPVPFGVDSDQEQQAPPARYVECPPKDFSDGEQLRRKTTMTKGTLQYMSPCGAKIYTSEMVSCESISALYADLTYFMPLIADDLQEIVTRKLNDPNFKFDTGKGKEIARGAF
jgi:hypothetical protein